MVSKILNLYLFIYLNFFHVFLKWQLVLVGITKLTKHLRNKTMQWIIFGEFKFGWLLLFEDVINKEKVVYDNLEVGK